MKSISLFLAACLVSLAVFAQNSIVTINVKGSTEREVFVDGIRYTLQADVNNVNPVNAPIVVNNLSAGQHTIRIVYDDNRQNDYVSYFTLRNGYDMTININSNGTIRTAEKVSGRNNNSTGLYKTPMTTTNFNKLLTQIRNQRRSIDKQTTIENALSNTANYFTSSQARQLVQIVVAQPTRLELAKLAYPQVTDPTNFSQVSNLIYGQVRKDDLKEYIEYYAASENSNGNTTVRTPMSVTAFNNLYRLAGQQYPSTQRRTYISNAFASMSNYFTTAQAMQLIKLLNDENGRLFLAKASFRGITDPENFNQVSSLLYIQANRNELTQYVTTYNGIDPSTGVGNTQAGRIPWTATYYNTVYTSTQQKWPSSTRVAYLADIFGNTANFYTASQARQLITLVNGESDRLQLAKAAYRGLSNTNEYTVFNDMFSYLSSRNELASYVTSYQSGNPVIYKHLAMSDEDFRTNYRNVQNEWLPFAKMTALEGIFNTETNYFSSTQARQLIQLVSSETNRLQLAKLAYGNVVDPENFNQLYDLLSSQASRDELAAYVSTYAGLGQ